MSEKGDPEKSSNGSLKAFNAENQRDQALALLPDPDIGKSDEEKAKIVCDHPWFYLSCTLLRV